MKNLKAIDLFCGCGGISKGLHDAGFTVIAGVDIEPKYIATFAHNFPDSKSLLLDLSSVSPSEFMKNLGIRSGELDLLAGGPPCQGFSKNVPRKLRSEDSANNQLVNSYLDYCEALRPRLIMMENVAEMKNGFEQAYTEKIFNRLTKIGYTVTSAVLNAADYGIPQRRRRAFFLATLDSNKLSEPAQTHFNGNTKNSLFPSASHITVWEAIGDLPSLVNGEQVEEAEYASPPLSEYQKITRKNKKTVRNHSARNLKSTQYKRIAALKPGQGLKDLPPELQVKGGFSGAYGRLTEDMIAPTITRWVFHPGSGRWGHPRDIRLITIREAARLQGFPDDFEFVGSYTDQAGQLGNAVPPLLAQKIAESMLNQSGILARASNAKNSSSESFSLSVGRLKETA